MPKRTQPAWSRPDGQDTTKLRLGNGLTGEQEIPVSQFKNRVLWNDWGPTIYDTSHMDHASASYVYFDIIRRVLSDYFGHNVEYVMNITDTDDKTVRRARQDFLYEKYIGENCTNQILHDVREVLYTLEDTDKKKSALESMVTDLERAVVQKDKKRVAEFQEVLLKEAKYSLTEWLDKTKGSTVTDSEISTKLFEHLELAFYKDMDALNILRPSVVRRLSTYIDKITTVILRLIKKGLAYESNGSVYLYADKFNVQEKANRETNGDLNITESNEKRSDFALWESSRAGESSWDSPWGKGRPGRYIKCSVTGSEMCGESLDIHTGGEDLRFPKLCNKFDRGLRLTTDHSCKMSKLLKNFASLQDVLKKYSAMQLRLAFLLHSWQDTSDCGDNTMHMVVQYEELVRKFFSSVNDKMKNLGTKTTINNLIKWSNEEKELNEKFSKAKHSVHKALCDNVDTRTVMEIIQQVVVHCNSYVKQDENPNILLLWDIAVYIRKMFTIFGAISPSDDSFGFLLRDKGVDINAEKIIRLIVEILVNFPEKIRDLAESSQLNEIVLMCEKLRDDVFANLYVDDTIKDTYITNLIHEKLYPKESDMPKRTRLVWRELYNNDVTKLRLFNSLTKEKEIFVPQLGDHVKWYSCGPTVYDASHMGHARSYMSFDILRRVMSDYFGYDVFYVMNITDIDDKIIKRARQKFLYEKYVEENRSPTEVLRDAREASRILEITVKTASDESKKSLLGNILSKMIKAVEDLGKAVAEKDEKMVAETQGVLLKEAKDLLAEWLDKMKGDTITEHSIFKKLSQYWEEEFYKDMDALNVLRPNVVTRVSEYIPEIITFIEQVMKHGFAYESNGSVYFDVEEFDKRKEHFYAKLVPEAYGNTSSLQEGEGDLSVTEDKLNEKRSVTDFALWKNSKAGEPWWDSPWGKGRPGWHIECSVMASEMCGESLDIHTGGVDLKFPHHDNELAQAEAYHDNSHWVRYFLHCGHLNIVNCKMSKSLKNFVTIQDALKKHSARKLRLVFLLHSWKDCLEYSDNTMNMATQYEKSLNEFFWNVKWKIRSQGIATVKDNLITWSEKEKKLAEKFDNAKAAVHEALCDNVDTRTVLDVIRKLVTNCNAYMSEDKCLNTRLLWNIAEYITEMFIVFGVIPSSYDSIGFPIVDGILDAVTEESIMQIAESLANFREEVRNCAKTLKAHDILQECDTLRDDVLPSAGIRLEDSDEEGWRLMFANREDLLKEREEKRNLEVEKAREKKRKKEEAAAAAAEKEAQRRIPPCDMFKSEKDKYSRFDETGLPTHDTEGKEISKKLLKKLQKLQELQNDRYRKYLKEQASENSRTE